jgi:hypothetical protein
VSVKSALDTATGIKKNDGWQYVFNPETKKAELVKTR